MFIVFALIMPACPTTEAVFQAGRLPAQAQQKGCFAQGSFCFRRPEI
jgi:hypothetical protein